MPAPIRYFAMTASSCTSKGTIALSVVMSQMTDPALSCSPRGTLHSTILPDSIVGDKLGNVTTLNGGTVDNEREKVVPSTFVAFVAMVDALEGMRC